MKPRAKKTKAAKANAPKPKAAKPKAAKANAAKPKAAKRAAAATGAPADVTAVVATLARLGTRATREGMARYGIVAPKAFGVTVGELRALGKRLGRSHELAQALWDTEWYEARMLACFVEDPKQVTPAQMDAWSRDFDNWAICDTACFHLFDRTPHAWDKVTRWAERREEFVKRASFALMASLTVHDKGADDDAFLRCLPLVERAATDDRNFVMKAVNWALRSIGKRSSRLHTAAIDVARRLADAKEPTPRWVGKDALRELSGPSVARRLAARGR